MHRQALSTNVVVMGAAFLDQVEELLPALRRKASEVCGALRKARVSHAVIGGLAVAAHVQRKDPAAVRTTRDMDLLLSRDEVGAAAAALKPLGYHYRKVLGIPAFVPAGGKSVDAVHVVLAGERVRDADPVEAPVPAADAVLETEDGLNILGVAPLLRMKLTSFRLKDQVHIQDLMAVGLITRKVVASLPPSLRERYEAVRAQTERERLA